MELHGAAPIHALFILRRVTDHDNTRSVEVTIQEEPQIDVHQNRCSLKLKQKP